MAGIISQRRGINSGLDWLPSNTPPPTPVQNQYTLYNQAVGQQAGDYDSIMQAYRGILQNSQNTAPNSQVTPQQYTYQPSADVNSALGIQKNLAQTGGYDEQGLSDLRARGISPIRSVYASANRDIDRQRALSGGFSPNYNAAKTKMAREMSESIAQQVSNVNAGIAQNVASNKLQAAPAYASTAMGESSLRNDIGLKNADAVNNANTFNANAADKTNSNALSAVNGMTSLYGTTPALSNLFGQQAQNAASMEANSQDKANSNAYGAINSLSQRLARRM